MFERLFGHTEEEQLEYLQIRVIVTVFCIVGAVLGPALGIPNVSAALAAIIIFVWGWGAVKGLFGITAISAIFSGNLVVGILLFIFYIFVAYIVGLFCMALGIGRYIYLKIIMSKR